jgi:hypothetical protein
MAKVFLSYKYQDNPYDPVGYFLERAFKNLGHEVYHEAVSGLDLAIFLPPSACNQDMKNNELGGVPVFYWEIDSTRKKKLEPLGAYDQLFIDNKEQDEFKDYKFPKGSTVYDPWGIIKPQDGVNIVSIGRWGRYR